MDIKQRRAFLQSPEWKAFRQVKRIQQPTDPVTRFKTDQGSKLSSPGHEP